MDVDALRADLADPKRALASDAVCTAVAAELERNSVWIARNMGEREEVLTSFAEIAGDMLWTRLGAWWPVLADALDPSPSTSTSSVASEVSRIALAASVVKLERNLVAGVYGYQVAASSHGADIRRLIFNVTTYNRIEDSNYFLLQTVLAQLLSNLVSPMEGQSDFIANENCRLLLSGKREDDVIIRFLDSRVPKVNTPTLTLICNLFCGSERLLMLLQPEGIKWLSQILGRMDDWHEEDDNRFDMALTLFSQLIKRGQQGKLFDALSVSDEPITPSQLTLLKLVDSQLVSENNRPNPAPSPYEFIIPAWNRVAAYATASMKSGADDPRLAVVLAAVILATESLSNIVLAAQARLDSGNGVSPSAGGDEKMVAEMKGKEGAKSIIHPLVALLGETNAYLPRVKPKEQAPEEPLPFSNVKRDLVRLLSVLTFNDTAVGDAVREAGGVELVLSLCETDDRNPYLREHALLCVRNLMMGNPANQEIIKQMDPVGIVGENGELLPLPERLKKANLKSGTGSS